MNRNDFRQLLSRTKLVLPPMCGYTDYPYRRILAKFGGEILCTEMIKAKAFFFKNDRTLKMLARSEEEPFTGVQLLGSEPEVMAKAAKVCQDMGFSFVDINLGCPVKKVISKKEGGALLKDLEQIRRILEAVRQVITIPLTVKTRLGFKSGEFTALKIARIAEEIGLDAVTIHGRSIEQKYSGKVDWTKIAEVVRSVNVPVIANGGIDNGVMAKEMLVQTGALAVMPGRAILGDPWLIGEILHHLHGTAIEHHRSVKRVKETALEHFDSMVQFYGERSACLCMRRFFSLYFKGIFRISVIRKNLGGLNSRSDFLSMLKAVETR